MLGPSTQRKSTVQRNQKKLDVSRSQKGTENIWTTKNPTCPVTKTSDTEVNSNRLQKSPNLNLMRKNHFYSILTIKKELSSSLDRTPLRRPSPSRYLCDWSERKQGVRGRPRGITTLCDHKSSSSWVSVSGPCLIQDFGSRVRYSKVLLQSSTKNHLWLTVVTTCIGKSL